MRHALPAHAGLCHLDPAFIANHSLKTHSFILAAITHDLSNKFDANSIIKELAPIIGGKGGGKKDLAQAGGNNPSGLKDAIEKSYKIIEIMLT